MKVKNIIFSKKIIYKYRLLKLNNKKLKKYSDVEKYVSKIYEKKFGQSINWDNPISYNEKMNFSKIYCFSDIKTKLTDKYLVRNWIKEIIGKKYLIPILGVYDSFKQINFNNLPSQFVIKCNHDCASVTLVDNKNEINLRELKIKYDYLIRRNYALLGYELHYNNIKPKIIIEKYLGKSINDYKFQCFNGMPYWCAVDCDRFGNHRRNIYDLNWNLMPFNKGSINSGDKIEKPTNYNEMIMIVKKLCKGFDQVRVDLYDVDGKIYFGEMTFTPASGMTGFRPKEWDKKLGDLWNLDISARKKLYYSKIDWDKNEEKNNK